MHSLALSKPDGRSITLYSSRPIGAGIVAPSPFAQPQGANPHLRWHALRGEWVAYAAYRQDRTYQPPPQYNPLAVTRDVAAPTELPAGDYEIAVFDNRFPALALDAHDAPALCVPSAPATGHCEVLVFSQDPAGALCTQSLARIALLFEVWAERTACAAATGLVRYVMPFENRGAEMGVTLHHPHGQIYSYPLVPPVPARMLAQEQAYFEQHGANLLVEFARAELAAQERVLYAGEHAAAFVPACARYPYETWVMPRAPVAGFAALSPEQRLDLARALKTVLLKYERLWERPFPYLMTWYQGPTDGVLHPQTQLHAELLPPYRSRERLKYLAGTELGAGLFAMDVLPETSARQLQQVQVSLDETGIGTGERP
jgi:UDPglucose--hexose-1-phosphate uridylyltransferase